MLGQLQECRAGGREFQVLGDATEKVRSPNNLGVNGTMSRFVLEDLMEQAECESTGGNVNMQAVSNVKY